MQNFRSKEIVKAVKITEENKNELVGRTYGSNFIGRWFIVANGGVRILRECDFLELYEPISKPIEPNHTEPYEINH